MPKGVYKHSSPSKETVEKRKKTIIERYGGGWNKGLTANTDERVRNYGLKQRGKKMSTESRLKMSLNSGMRSPKQRERARQVRLGKKTPISTRLKQSAALKGERSYLWRGGLTQENGKVRGSIEYRLWRESVFERDNYTCVWCGDAQGGNLNADHIKPFAYYPELRFAIDNGRTLCVPCHKTTDTYGSGALKFRPKD